PPRRDGASPRERLHRRHGPPVRRPRVRQPPDPRLHREPDVRRPRGIARLAANLERPPMRSLVLASVLLLATSFVALVPSAAAQPCPESPGTGCPPPCGVGAQPCYALGQVCTALQPNPACEGQLACVIVHALGTTVCVPASMCSNVTCDAAPPCLTCDPDVHNVLACAITYGGRSACVYDPCSEMACF